jgi:hypothetical protein
MRSVSASSSAAVKLALIIMAIGVERPCASYWRPPASSALAARQPDRRGQAVIEQGIRWRENIGGGISVAANNYRRTADLISNS